MWDKLLQFVHWSLKIWKPQESWMNLYRHVGIDLISAQSLSRSWCWNQGHYHLWIPAGLRLVLSVILSTFTSSGFISLFYLTVLQPHCFLFCPLCLPSQSISSCLCQQTLDCIFNSCYTLCKHFTYWTVWIVQSLPKTMSFPQRHRYFLWGFVIHESSSNSAGSFCYC